MGDIRAVIFDVGGTLINLDTGKISELMGAPDSSQRLDETVPGLRKSVNDFLLRPDAHTEAPDTLSFIMTEWARLAAIEIDAAALEALAAENRRQSLWRSVNHDAIGVPAELRDRGYLTAVVSNSDGSVEKLLGECGWAGEFDIVIDSGVVGIAKPDPRIFSFALERLGVEASETAYVGDLPAVDIVGAVRAGIAPILYDPCDVHKEDVESLGEELGCSVRRVVSMKELLELFPVNRD